ncbi:ATP-binding protein [Streptomyces sp. NPDC017936]|uniref:ATP-binding protein n=1 Tax=Streptomyces sp. NPDC017936 TaxID=3365016 RepID=UPI00379D31D4
MNQETQDITGSRTRPEPSGVVRDFTVLLSSTPRGARLARLLAVDALRSWGLPHERAGHVVAELAANAATHGRLPGRSFRLTLHVVGATLRIEVTDTRGDRLPAPQVPDAVAESGRGLLLVEALADRWGVMEGRFPRKTVWAELGLTSPEPEPSRSGAVDD